MNKRGSKGVNISEQTASDLSTNMADLSSKASVLNETAQLMVSLQRDLETKVSKDQVDMEVTKLRDQSRLDRLRVKSFAFSAVVIAVAVLAAAAFGMVAYTKARDAADHEYAQVAMAACKDRGRQADALRTYFVNREVEVKANPTINKEYQKAWLITIENTLKHFAPVDCTKLGQ